MRVCAESRDEVVTSAPGFKAAGSSLGSSLLDSPIFITRTPGLSLHYCCGRGVTKTTALRIGLFTAIKHK